jgi:hypothetical protein
MNKPPRLSNASPYEGLAALVSFAVVLFCLGAGAGAAIVWIVTH